MLLPTTRYTSGTIYAAAYEGIYSISLLSETKTYRILQSKIYRMNESSYIAKTINTAVPFTIQRCLIMLKGVLFTQTFLSFLFYIIIQKDLSVVSYQFFITQRKAKLFQRFDSFICLFNSFGRYFIATKHSVYRINY